MELVRLRRKQEKGEAASRRSQNARAPTIRAWRWPIVLSDAHSPVVRLGHAFGPPDAPLPHPLQAKLTVNEPGDQYEQEADRVAEQVMRMPDPAIRLQRKCGCGGTSHGTCDECANNHLQRQAESHYAVPSIAPTIVGDVLRSSGRKLDKSTRSLFESRFKLDFGRVRIHTDEQAARSARAVNALAYTVGNQIAFAAGSYQPGTNAGRKLLAHELAHVAQQSANTRPNQGGTTHQNDDLRNPKGRVDAHTKAELTPSPVRLARQTPQSGGGVSTLPGLLNNPECLGAIGEGILSVLATVTGAAIGGLLTGGLGVSAGAALANLLMVRRRTSPVVRVQRALVNQNFEDAFCVLNLLSMRELLSTLVSLSSQRSALRTNLAAASQFSQIRVTFALDVVDLQQSPSAFDCTRTPFRTLSMDDREAALDFLFPAGFPSPANTFFGRRIPGNLIRGMVDRMERAQLIAKRSLCLNGQNPNWVAQTAISTAGGGWHARNQAFDLDYLANPYVMHEQGEAALDRDLSDVYQRIAGLILLRDSIIPRDLLTVRGGPGTQRTWRNGVPITTGELYDLLRQESDSMTTYFELMLASRTAAPGATPNTATPITTDDFLQRFLSSPFVQAHPSLGIGTSAATLKTRIANDYLIVGGSSAQLRAFSGQTLANLGATNPANRPGDRPFVGGQPASAAPNAAAIRRPELGFLAIPREVVEALTEVGLAWGAIDIRGEPGDMMHFDCRLLGECR